jgi:hypothetical protein
MNIVPVINQFTNMDQYSFRAFCDDYGPHVRAIEDKIIFADGATVENASTDYKQMIPPPESKFERAILICCYWMVVSRTAEEEFTAYKSYLGGEGARRDEWCENVYTENDMLILLNKFQREAKRTRNRYLAAKRNVDKYTPEDMRMDEQHEVEQSQRKKQFQDRLETFQL